MCTLKNELINCFVQHNLCSLSICLKIRVQWRNILMNKYQIGFHGLWFCEFEALSNRNIQLEVLKMESGLIEGDNKNSLLIAHLIILKIQKLGTDCREKWKLLKTETHVRKYKCEKRKISATGARWGHTYFMGIVYRFQQSSAGMGHAVWPT